MKILTHYKQTKELLKFISDSWPDVDVGAIKTILIDAKEEIEERQESIDVNALHLDY